MKRLIILSLGLLATKSAFAADAPRHQQVLIPAQDFIPALQRHQQTLTDARNNAWSAVSDSDRSNNLWGKYGQEAKTVMNKAEALLVETQEKVGFAGQERKHWKHMTDGEWSDFVRNQSIVVSNFIARLNDKVPKLEQRAAAIKALHNCYILQDRERREAKARSVKAVDPVRVVEIVNDPKGKLPSTYDSQELIKKEESRKMIQYDKNLNCSPFAGPSENLYD